MLRYTIPESIRQQTRRRGSIAKVLIYAKLHEKFKVAEILNVEKENVLESNISVLPTQDDIPGASSGNQDHK